MNRGRSRDRRGRRVDSRSRSRHSTSRHPPFDVRTPRPQPARQEPARQELQGLAEAARNFLQSLEGQREEPRDVQPEARQPREASRGRQRDPMRHRPRAGADADDDWWDRTPSRSPARGTRRVELPQRGSLRGSRASIARARGR